MKNKTLVEEAPVSETAFDQNSDELVHSDKKKKKSKGDKESKKRKAVEVAEDEDRSDTSSELGEPVNSRLKSSSKDKKSGKKVKLIESDEDAEDEKAEDPNAVSRFRISEPLRERLKEKGILSLFPIQAMTFDTVFDGSDLVGRARTGQVLFFWLINR